MASYIGFSTINAGKPRSKNMQSGSAGGVGSIPQPIVYGKKFRLTDEKLVIQDLVNAFNIQQGQKVGNPAYGTSLWSHVFSPNTSDIQQTIIAEVRRVVAADPRLVMNTIKAYAMEQGILVELELAVTLTNTAQLLNLFFNTNTRQVSLR